jgi:membrane protein
MFPLTSIRIVYRACEKWNENGGARLGAAFAYYALFSLAPMLVIAVQVAGVIFGDDAAHGEVHKRLNGVMGAEVAQNAEAFVKIASQPHDTGWSPTISILFLVVASLGAFLHLRGALSTIWKLDPPRGNSWLGVLWDYALSLIMVFLTAVLLLCSLTIGLVIPMIQNHLSRVVEEQDSYWHWVEIGISFVFLTFLFAVAYRVLSGGRIPWGYVWYGSFIAAVLFTIGKTLLAYYIVYSGTATMYGAAGSVIVFLVWVYYSSQILFFGAELIQARRTRYEWLYDQKPEAQG